LRNILQVSASPRTVTSLSRLMADEITARLSVLNPATPIIERDLALQPPPHPGAAYAEALVGGPDQDPASFGPSEAYIRELEAARFLVIATPMHNFTVPSALKAWLDHVVRIHRTFRSTPEGKVGLLADRPTVIVTASGGYFLGERARQPDFLTPYLTAILNTIGIRDISFVALEGVTRGGDALVAALTGARAWLDAAYPLSMKAPA
jgi:FMN-dependent NADH-azoreductase